MPAKKPSESRAQRERKFFADWNLNPVGDALRWQRELELLRQARPSGLGSVLSLGCGRGTFETLLAEQADHVVGIDLSPESISEARDLLVREKISNVEFLCADVASFELERDFDTVICIGFLHHLSDREGLELLMRIHSHLRDGGLLHTQDPNAHGLLRKIGRVVLGRRYDRFHSDDERELDPRTLRRMFIVAGFERADIRYMDLCLIPAMQIFPTAPAWVMRLFAFVDRIWCALPGARFASGFSVDAIR